MNRHSHVILNSHIERCSGFQKGVVVMNNTSLDFETKMRAFGYSFVSIIADGKIHRFGPKKRYWYIFNGSWGAAGDWKSEHPKVTWSQKNKSLNHHELSQLHQKIEEERRHFATKKLEQQNTQALEAEKQLNNFSKEGTSNYLTKKQIDELPTLFGKDQHGDFAAIPLQDLQGKTWNFQKIYDDSRKFFLPGARKKGCFYIIGELKPNTPLIFCEGYATGASLYKALSMPVIVCFDAGNLLPVIEGVHQKYPDQKLIIAADDDQYGATNAGKIHAEKAAQKHGCIVIYPTFQNIDTKPTDFNDLHCLEGLEQVKKQIDAALIEKRAKVYTHEEFLQMKIPPREMILAPIIPEKGLVMLYAPRGVGKTHVALYIAVTVAKGSGLFDNKWKAPKSVGVLLVDGEMPAHTLQERLLQMCEHTPQNYLKILSADLQEMPIPDLSTKEGQSFIEEHLEGIKLLILDNLSSLCRSGRENESESWQPMQEWLLSLRKRGISVLLIHHANKNGGQRGNSKKEDILDTVISLKRPTHYTPEDGAYFEVHYEKSRGFYGEEAKPFEVRLQVKDDELVWITTDMEDAQLNQILELQKQGLKQRDIAQELGVSPATVNRRLNQEKVKRPVKQEDK